MNFDPRLYFVLERSYLSGRDLHEVVAELVRHGVTLVQLRDKTISDLEMIGIGRGLKQMLDIFRVPLIVNDRVHVARKIGAAGVHLGQSDLSVHLARRILGPNAIIGLSCETVAQVFQEAVAYNVDYISASPIFISPTKKDIQKPWGIDGLAHLRQSVRLPIIAIGGIHSENIHSVLAAGANGVAMASTLMTSHLFEVSEMRILIDRTLP